MGWSIIDRWPTIDRRISIASGRSAGPIARVRAHRRSVEAEVLLPRDVRVPVGARARRARPQLHHRRRDGAHEADARLQRPASLRLGRLRHARRERRDQERHSSRRLHVRQHQPHEGAAPASRHQLCLGPRAGHVHARVLPLEPVALHPDVRARPRVPPPLDGELVPEGPDGPRQRAGRRRRRAGAAARRSSRATSSSGS